MRGRRRFSLTVFAVLSALGLASPAHAHGGGLDSLGCHHNRKAGGYHCHRGVLAGQHFASKADALLKLRGNTTRTKNTGNTNVHW